LPINSILNDKVEKKTKLSLKVKKKFLKSFDDYSEKDCGISLFITTLKCQELLIYVNGYEFIGIASFYKFTN